MKPNIKIPTGISDFALLVEDKYDFIDKSLFIKDIFNESTQALLLPRPRRFGKTLNMTMLYYFFSMHAKKTELFKGLKIAQCQETMEHAGKYPVIFISFKDIKQNHYQDAERAIKSLIGNLYGNFPELKNSEMLEEKDKNLYQRLFMEESSVNETAASLQLLCKMLYEHHGIKPILLIDEYDAPIHNAYQHGYYSEMISLMQVMLGSALKDNIYLGKAVLTGILKVAKESIFSGLNNIIVSSILSTDYNSSFGFTEEEVIGLLQQANYQDKLPEVRKWYNGYNFAGVQIYNPWSIINYIKNGAQPIAYWVNTGGANTLVRNLIEQASIKLKQHMERLIIGEGVELRIDENIIFKDLDEKGYKDDMIWNLFFFSGYLTAQSTRIEKGGYVCKLVIPNEEILSIYQHIFLDWTKNSIGSDSEEIAQYLISGKMELFVREIKKYFMTVASFHDFTRESDYHCFLLGLITVLTDRYIIKSNRESGEGRLDLFIAARNGDDGIIIELKHVKDEENIQESAQEGLAQITEKKYEMILSDYPYIKKLTRMCLAFSKREVIQIHEIDYL